MVGQHGSDRAAPPRPGTAFRQAGRGLGACPRIVARARQGEHANRSHPRGRPAAAARGAGEPSPNSAPAGARRSRRFPHRPRRRSASRRPDTAQRDRAVVGGAAPRRRRGVGDAGGALSGGACRQSGDGAWLFPPGSAAGGRRLGRGARRRARRGQARSGIAQLAARRISQRRGRHRRHPADRGRGESGDAVAPAAADGERRADRRSDARLHRRAEAALCRALR